MHLTARLSALVAGLGLLLASPATAQTAIAHFSQVEGEVTRLHRFAPTIVRTGVLLVDGDEVRTAIGRAELSCIDGSVLHLDRHTRAMLGGAGRIRLLDGRVTLHAASAYVVETASGILHIQPDGIFELTAGASNRDLLVRVVEGHARIESPWGSEAVSSTQTAFISGPTGRPFVAPWVHAQEDAFSQWAQASFIGVTPPPTFLPYAHPTYRQFAYDRYLRKQRHAHAGGDQPRNVDRPRVHDGSRHDGTARRAPRRDADRGPAADRPRQAGENRRRDEPPAPARPPRTAKPVRGAGAGAVVPPPQ